MPRVGRIERPTQKADRAFPSIGTNHEKRLIPRRRLSITADTGRCHARRICSSSVAPHQPVHAHVRRAPISAPMNSSPSANWVDALCSTMALSTLPRMLSNRSILRHNGVSMMRAIPVDVLHCFWGFPTTRTEMILLILRVPIIRGRHDTSIRSESFRIAAHLVTRLRKVIQTMGRMLSAKSRSTTNDLQPKYLYAASWH